MKKFYKKKGSYHPDDPMWVIGCIDSNGAIVARSVNGNGRVMHAPEESKGRRWRWNIWAQEFFGTRNPTLDHLTDEEWDIVTDWLEKKGFKKPNS